MHYGDGDGDITCLGMGHQGVDGTTGTDRDVEGLEMVAPREKGTMRGWGNSWGGAGSSIGLGAFQVRTTMGCGLRVPGLWCLKGQVFFLADTPHAASASFCCVAGTTAMSWYHFCLFVTVLQEWGRAGLSCCAPDLGGLLEPLCSHLLIPGVPVAQGGHADTWGRYWSGLCRSLVREPVGTE